MPHQLIASPYPDGHIVVSPGRDGGIRIGAARFAELSNTPAAALVPSWLAAPARAAWNLDLTGRTTGQAVIVRPETAYGYARASYELNLGCNYDCEHCYLGSQGWTGPDENSCCKRWPMLGCYGCSSPGASRSSTRCSLKPMPARGTWA